MTKITVTADDFHRHLRRYELLKILLRHLGAFTRATIMPNPKGDVITARDVVEYKLEIQSALPPDVIFEPLMTIKLTPQTTPETILEARRVGAVAAKYYPVGMTTGSDNGVDAEVFRQKDDWFASLSEANMLLLIHGEHNQSSRCLDRELDFLRIIKHITLRFPRLRIVMEHITTSLAVTAIESLPKNIAATITPHHLYLTLNDIVGGLLHPHNFCKPLAKWEPDRIALVKAAISGNPKFFGGTDCAAHKKSDKESANGCAGVFTGSLGPLFYAEQFDKAGGVSRLPAFLGKWGAEHYQLPYNRNETLLAKRNMQIPTDYDGIIPFRAGETLSWSYA